MKYFFLIILLVFGCALQSCTLRYKKYESNWIVVKCQVDGKNFLNEIRMRNFEINVNRLNGFPPTLHRQTAEDRQKRLCKLRFFRKGGKDYMEVTEHYFFSGVYEIRCHDKNCCVISIENDRVYMEMDYNGRLPFGKGRDCPKPRFGLMEEEQERKL